MIKKIILWLLIALVILVVIVVGGVVIWANTATAEPMPEAFAALESSAKVEVNTDNWLVFTPQQTTPTTGFIFYPGGLVDPRAYAPPAHAIAAEGYQVVIVPMPLNLAVFGSGNHQLFGTARTNNLRYLIFAKPNSIVTFNVERS